MPALLVVVLTVLGFDIDTGTISILWPVGSIIWLIAGYYVHKEANQADINASLARTKDPEYIELLIKAGYRVYEV